MGSLTRSFTANDKKEAEGVWIEIAVNDDDSIARIKTLRMGPVNKKFAKLFASLGKKFARLKGDTKELELRALRQAFVHTCLVDWENIENINEAPVSTDPSFPAVKDEYMPFTHENAMKLFEQLPELFDYVVGEASDIENFQSKETEEEVKN